MQKERNGSGDNFKPHKSYVFLGVSVLITMGAALYIYRETQSLFKLSLQERVKAIAQTAVLAFETEDLDKIIDKESTGNDAFVKVTFELQKLREKNPNLKFAYIYRRTKEPHIFEYVSDADSMYPDIPIDLNLDGIIDEADALVFPGDQYDASDYPKFIEDAFVRPYVGDELEYSQWGWTLDATAPISDANEVAQYVLGVDVDVSEFIKHTNMALVPFMVFVTILIVVLTLLTIILVKMWGARVEFFKELDRQKDELLSIVSHQLATPVSSVRYYLEMLQDGDFGELTKEQKGHILTMHGVIANLSDLVSMILDVSRIQLGKIKIEKQELDLNSFFKEILDVIEPKAKEKGVKFTISKPESLPQAQLDKRHTRMTIENLLSNAVKYTPEGGEVKCTIRIDGNRLHCEVKDTGCGIPKSDQDKIFGKLFRASNVRNAVDGNGFGLYVAKGAVDAQGGKIWFESEESKGTTFYLRLPILEEKS